MARVRYYSKKRRSVYAKGETFTHLEIFERDEWVCQLCFEPVDPELRKPDPMCATIDHKVPLAHNGSHTRANVQLAHHSCNQKKSDDIDYDLKLRGTLEK